MGYLCSVGRWLVFPALLTLHIQHILSVVVSNYLNDILVLKFTTSKSLICPFFSMADTWVKLIF